MDTPTDAISYGLQIMMAYIASLGAESQYEYRNFNQIGIMPDNFNMYASCEKSLEHPVIDNRTIVLPLGSDNESCPQNFIDAVTNLSYPLNTLKFDGTFKGGSIAPNDLDELVVFATNDTNNYTSQEMGFRLNLKDNILYGYVQDGTGEPEGWTLFKNIALVKNPDRREHEYMVKVRERGRIKTFYFYIDTKLRGKLIINTPSKYYDVPYHIVGTTHRRENGWDCDGACLLIRNISIR